MKLIIQTQYEENYGAHSWDGEGKCPQYWKYKGGATYIVRDISAAQVMATEGLVAGLVAQLAPKIESRNEASAEYITKWSLVDDCEDDGVEEWEDPWVIKQDGDKFIATRSSDMYSGATSSYTMLDGGQRADYKLVKAEDLTTD